MEFNLQMYDILKERLVKKEEYRKLDMIERRIEYASNLLDLVRDTFPTYTLHNRIHSINVIKKMEMLIGDHIFELSDMEITLLILSAFYHDIGMVYDADFKENLPEHPQFQNFLENNPDIALSYYDSLSIDNEMVELFCRIYHAQNSYEHIMNMPEGLFYWNNNISLRNSLAIICRSHGENIDVLNSKEFETDYMYEADLKFCSIMLRLGDVLDFDYTRTPNEIYDYLKLNRKKTTAQRISDEEWRKHLSSNGLFCSEDKSVWNIVAVPNTPKTAHDLLDFLKYIESELAEAGNVLKTCSAKKQLIIFPLHIDRSKIHNKDFIYGDYKFSISNDNLLNLFMGKNLYLDKYTFIRELIQNSIDTTIQRNIIEKDIDEKEIDVRTYLNGDYEAFFSVEDYGMGMDLDIIQNYLLKVGESYYESNRFKAFMAKKHKKMTSISKFGIGLLSCFLISNEIKIYTRYYNSDTTYEIVLDGINGFFAIKDIPSINENYLKHYGSKVIVSISPGKEDFDFNYESYINKITLHSRIKINFNGKQIEQNNEVVDKAWGQYDEIDLSGYKDHLLKSFNKTNVTVNRMLLKIFPIDITKYSNCKNLRGEGLICQLDIENIEELLKQEKSDYERRFLGIRFDFDKIALRYSYEVDFPKIKDNLDRILYEINKINQQLNDNDECKLNYIVTDSGIKELYHSQNKEFSALCKEYIDLSDLLEKYSLQQQGSKNDHIYFFNEDTRRAFSKILRKENGLLSHNGILIKQNECQCVYTTYIVILSLALEDDLRPVLGLSRGELISQTWDFYATYFCAIINALKQYNFSVEDIHIPFESLVLDNTDYGYLSRIFKENLDEWKLAPIFKYEGKYVCINELPTNKFIKMPLLELKSYYYKSKFLDIARAILLQIFYNITLDEENGEIKLNEKKEDIEQEEISKSVFPPTFFVQYRNGTILKKYNCPLNNDHTFSKWLINNSNYLHSNYNEYFNKIIRILIDDSTSLRAKKLNKILERIIQMDQNNYLKNIPNIKDDDFRYYAKS